jgi:ubiquilin
MSTGLGASSPYGVGGYEAVNHPQYMSAISSAVDPEKMEEMMNDPQTQGMIEEMLKDPDTLRHMINENPMLSKMVRDNPMMKTVLENPALLKMVMSNSTSIQIKMSSRNRRNL